jgi:hypothetical protein
MRRAAIVCVIVILALGALHCGGGRKSTPTTTVMVPPRIDLEPHQTIGVIEFDSASRGELAPLATTRFTESARRDQGLVRMIDLGSRADALRGVGRTTWDPETFKALGEKHGIRTIIAGEITISDVKPDISIASSLRSGSVTAEVDATLAVEMIETETGASIWNASARARDSVGHVSLLSGGHVTFDADDPERVYGGLIDALVTQATTDFQVSWVRR